jgi:hypothetical protein
MSCPLRADSASTSEQHKIRAFLSMKSSGHCDPIDLSLCAATITIWNPSRPRRSYVDRCPIPGFAPRFRLPTDWLTYPRCRPEPAYTRETSRVVSYLHTFCYPAGLSYI